MKINVPDLLISGVNDLYLRKNFERLRDYFFLNHHLANFKFFEITFLQAETNFKYNHGLGFLPQDILQLRKTGAGAITYNYELFDKDTLDITVTGACVVRFFAGTYEA